MSGPLQKVETTTYTHRGHPVIYNPEDGASVTTSDTTVLQPGTLYVGATGDVKVRTRAGTDLTFKNVPVGWMPILVDMVYSTGTTASEILILR